MGLKIALMYLDVSNWGDLVIYETARYIIEDILKKNEIRDYEIIPVDIGSFHCRSLNTDKVTIKRLVAAGLKVVAKNKILSTIFPRFSRKVWVTRWHLTNPYKYYIENEKDKLEGANIIIFGGGGLIKFHKQNFHYFLDDVTQYAEKREIPVLINAQGVEGYNEYNQECQILKTALNRNCVKYVSTRDDFAMLRNCYIDNPRTVVKGVCDPAFWTKETYGVQKKAEKVKKVGLNVIRTKIFGEYMYKVDCESLGQVYYDLIKKIHEHGYQVELFSNGVDKDIEFIDWLLEAYPDLQADFGVSVENPKSTRELVELLAGYERFMAVRLHAAIIGSVLGVPNVSLVWNKKQILFGKEIGMSQNFITKTKFEAEEIFKRLFEAQPYQMNETYKKSVYENLEREIKKWI